jgi:ABC-type nickel/cobalt efflux system permease component RcnA
MVEGTASLVAAATVLGLVHGAEPGHGWPIAATYALDRSHRWLSGLVAALVIGVGHLVSSVAVVAAFLLAASFLDVSSLGWVRYVAGVLLVALGVREYRHGHSHAHGEGESEYHDDGEPSTFATGDDAPSASGVLDTVDHSGDQDHGLDADDPRGLVGLASAAFVLGFAHEEEFEILGFCTGAADHCLELMLVYAVAVVLSLVALTLMLVAGYDRYEARVERYAEHLPTLSAVVLVLMGLGFIAGVL